MSPRRSASSRPFPRRMPRGLEELRKQVSALEGWGAQSLRNGATALSLGVPEMDARLPWGGLPRGALHEIFAADVDDAGAATGFCAALAALLLREPSEAPGPVLWCEGARTLDAGGLYAPGLARFRLAPEDLIAVRTTRDADVLWAMEEGLRAGRLAAVIGELDSMSLTASRRLQLAAEEGGGTALLLRPHSATPAPSAAVTRWRIAARPETHGETEQASEKEPGLGAAGWRAEMFRCRGGSRHTWEMEWRDETGGFTLAAPFRDGPALPRSSRMAG